MMEKLILEKFVKLVNPFRIRNKAKRAARMINYFTTIHSAN